MGARLPRRCAPRHRRRDAVGPRLGVGARPSAATATASTERRAPVLVVSLVTRGSPSAGHAAGICTTAGWPKRAPARYAGFEFVSTTRLRNPLRQATRRRARRQPHAVVGRPVGGAPAAGSPAGGDPPPAAGRRRPRPRSAPLWQRPTRLRPVPALRPAHRRRARRSHDELVEADGLPAERIRVVEPGSDLPDRCGSASRRPAPRPPDRAAERRQLAAEQGRARAARGGRRAARRPTPRCTSSDAPTSIPATPPQVRTPPAARPTWPRRVVVHGAVTRSESAGCTPVPTCSCSPATPRRTARSSARRWRPGLPTVGWRSGNLPNLHRGRARGMPRRRRATSPA